MVLRSLTAAPQGIAWPFRLVWIIEDIKRDWAPRTDTRRDLQLLAESGLMPKAYDAGIDDVRLARCLALYRELYLDIYSAFNPDYTLDGLRGLMAEDALEIHTLESGDGEIVAFCGLYADSETVTLPMMGYDRSRPQGDGIYRIIQANMAGIAAARGLKLNLSAGAPHFKRHRGPSHGWNTC
ncbi:MAG: GNAT family N-acetyltransferase [Asticcacaulis sp.]